MENHEQLGLFYLGKKYDLDKQNITDSLLLYDSKDLVTHAICLGMTGSGKTGLCLVLLEEAIIDKIPVIIIDPKGDISNLLLTFPNLSKEDFLPWVNEEDAAKNGVTVDEFAKQQAELWKKGLQEWGQTPDRISRLRNSANFIIYTPGSETGIPISILDSFSIPPYEILNDNELLFERIANTITGLLSLIGIEANPIESREHILLSKILETNWKKGKNLTLEEIIRNVQTPDIPKIGVLDLESFFHSTDRFKLVMLLNNLLSSSSFSLWMKGVPMNIQNLLFDNNGKPNVSIISISHLNDNERMFFVTLLLNQIVSWMRTQSGTSSLRAVLYMDEIIGFLPPVANPPSKAPFISLLKQARAFGLGILLATQNPIDLDYKALSNIGTWFLGRLQTQRDKLRLLDGLEGLALKSDNTFDREKINNLISGLENRIFLMNNIHDDTPVLFHTRWAMSYLRGPITRNQIKSIMDPIRSVITTSFKNNQIDNGEITYPKQIPNGNPETKDVLQSPKISTPTLESNNFEQKVKQDKVHSQPTVNPGISQYYISLSYVKSITSSILDLTYLPVLFAFVSINFKNLKAEVDILKDYSYIIPFNDSPLPVDWDKMFECSLPVDKLENYASIKNFSDLVPAANKKENYEIWKKDLVNKLAITKKFIIYQNTKLNLFSKDNESEGDFKIRVQTHVREYRDSLLDKLREKYSSRFNVIKEKITGAQRALEVQRQQADQQKINTVFSVGSNLLDAFIGRKTKSARERSMIIKNVGRTFKEQKDISKAKETLESLYIQYSELESEFKKEILEIESLVKYAESNILPFEIKPSCKDIHVQLFTLVWLPLTENKFSGIENVHL